MTDNLKKIKEIINSSTLLNGSGCGRDYLYKLIVLMADAVTELNDKIDRVVDIGEALKAYQKFNHIRNDSDAYLHALGVWALNDGVKPDPKDFGIPAKETP